MPSRSGKRIPRPALNPLKMLSRYDSQRGFAQVAGRMMSIVDSLKRGDVDAKLWDEVTLYVTALRNIALRYRQEDAMAATKIYVDTLAAIIGRQQGDEPLRATDDELGDLAVYGEALVEWAGNLQAKEIYKAEIAAREIVRRANAQLMKEGAKS